MAKRALPEKRPLTSLDDDREIMQVQKEPHKVLQPLEPLAPLRVDMNAVIQNVQNQIHQSQQSYYTDEYISEGFIQHGTQPTSIRMLHPVADVNPVNDTNAMQEQDNQRPLEVVNGPVVAPPVTMLAGEFDMSNAAARTLYDQLIQPRDDFKLTNDIMIDSLGSGFKVTYNVPSTMKGIGAYYCGIDFKALRAVAVNEQFRAQILTTQLNRNYILQEYLDKNQNVILSERNILVGLNIPVSQLQVYWLLDYDKFTTDEYVEYFRKLFFLFAVDKNLEYFLGDQHVINRSRRANLTRTHVTWNKLETTIEGAGGLANKFNGFNVKETFLGNNTHYPEGIIYQVDVSQFTVVMEVEDEEEGEDRRIYFQVVCTKNNIYIITNLFNDPPVDKRNKKKKLPRHDIPFSFTYKNMFEEGEFEERADEWKDMEIDRPALMGDTPYQFRVTHTPKGWRRKAAPPELVYVINFRFDFLFPIALARRNVEKGIDDPVFFTDINHVSRTKIYGFDPVMIFENDWKILHDFILTFLFPKQFLLPTATGAVEDGVDEQHVDQPAEQSAGQQVGQMVAQPVMDQLMDHAAQQNMPLEDTTSDTECPPERLMELEEEPSEEIGNVSQLPPIYSQ